MADDLEEALSRIRGPQVEDFFKGPDQAEPGPQRGIPQAINLDSSPIPPANLPTPPGFLRRPDGSLRSMDPQKTAEGFVEKQVAEDVGNLGQTGATGLRLGAAMVPYPARVPALMGAEVFAQTLEAFGGTEPSVTRGGLNVAAGMVRIPGVEALTPTPVRRFVGRTAENLVLNEAYKWSAYETGVGEKPTVDRAVAEAPATAAFSAVFAAPESAGMRVAQHEAAQKRSTASLRQVELHQKNGGSTFDIDGNDLIGKDAWSVSIFPDRAQKIEDRPPSAADFDAFKKANADLFAGGQVHTGSWKETNPETGKDTHYLDAVVTVKDRDQAIALAKQHDQKAIFNLKSFEELPTGGSGEVKSGAGMPSIAERLKSIPSDKQNLFGSLRQGASEAATRLSKWYAASPLSDKKGEIRLDVLTGGGFRSDPKLKMSPEQQTIRKNLSRLAADDIMHGAEPTNKEKWSAKMIERYGKDVTPHLAQAWKNGNVLLDRVAKGSITELPNTAKAMELLQAGKDVAEWYEPMHRELRKYFGPDTETFMRFIAITSPRQPIKTNLQSALKLYVQWKAGAREASPDAIEMARAKRQNAALRANGAQERPLPTKIDTAEGEGFRSVLYPEWAGPASRGEDIGGPKVRNFFYGMRGDKTKGDHNAVVIDSWIQRYMGYKEAVNAEGESEPPGMSDTEYEIVSDYLRVQAEKTGAGSPSRFQARIWGGIKETWPGAREGDTAQPYYKLIEQRRAAGRPIFDDVTLSRFNKHETAVAKEIDDLFQSQGVVHPEAAAPAENANSFDWGSGTENKDVVTGTAGKRGPSPATVTTSKRAKTKRPGQSGEVKLSLLLPVDAFLKAAKGVKNLAEYTKGATARWGESVRPYLPEAWRTGATRATRLAALGERAPESRLPRDTTATPQRVAKESPLSLVGTTAEHEPHILDAFGRHSDDGIESLMKFKAALAKEEGHSDAPKLARDVDAFQKNEKTPATILAAKKKIGWDETQKIVAQYPDPVDQARALRWASRDRGLALAKNLYSSGIVWNFLGTVRVPLKIAYINATRSALRVMSTIPAAAYDRVMHRGGRAVYLHELTPGQAGFVTGFRHGAAKAFDLVKSGVTQENLLAGKYGQEVQTGWSVADFAANAPGRLLGAMDHLFIEPIAEHESHAMIYARARDTALKEGRSGDAMHERMSELQEQWRLDPPAWATEHKARVGRRLGDQAGFGNGSVANLITKLSRVPVIGPNLAPFSKSILNAARSALQTFTPYGLVDVRGLRKAQGSREAAVEFGKKRGYGGAEMNRARENGGLAREESMRVGEMVVGHAAMVGLLAYSNIFSGSITGNAPSGMSNAERDQLASERPWRAVHTPAGWADLNTTLGAAAPVVLAIVDAHTQYLHDTKIDPEHPAAAKDKYSAALDAGFQGLMGMVNGVPLLDQQARPGMETVYKKLATAVPFVPGVLRNITALTDPYQRKTTGIGETLQAYMPGKSGDLEARIRATGEGIKKSSLINPFSTTPTSPNSARNEAAALGVQVGPPGITELKRFDGNSVPLTVPTKKIVNAAMARAQSLALNQAKRQVAENHLEGASAKMAYEKIIGAYHNVVLIRMKAAATQRATMTIGSLTEGLE